MKIRSFSQAINKNNEELALMLVRRGASVTYRDELGNAPLHEAVRKNMIEVVKVSRYESYFEPCANQNSTSNHSHS